MITLNGEPFAVDDGPISLSDLLARLGIDPRIIAVEHNISVVKRDRYGSTIINEGDQVEIVRFVGGG